MYENDDYDLLSRPWLPVLTSKGENKKVGIRETIEKADEIVEIVGDTPSQTLALLRLIIAITASSLQDKKFAKLVVEIDALLPEVTLRYLDKHSKSFRLFDKKHPFLQVPGLVTQKKEKNVVVEARKSISLIAMNQASGNNVLLADHTTDATSIMDIDMCARWLVTTQSQVVKTGIHSTQNPSKTTPTSRGPCTEGACFIAGGASLAETIILNLPPAKEGDRPSWEADTDQPGTKRDLLGPIDGMTSCARSIRIIPPEPGESRVRQAYVTQGVYFKSYEDPFWLSVEKKGKGKNKETEPFKFSAGRENNLLPCALSVLPQAVQNFPSLQKADSLHVYGLTTSNAKIVMACFESINLSVLGVDRMVDFATKANLVATVVRSACYGKALSSDKDGGIAADRAESTYWYEIGKYAGITDDESVLVRCAEAAALATVGPVYVIKEHIAAALHPPVETVETTDLAGLKMGVRVDRGIAKAEPKAEPAKPDYHKADRKPVLHLTDVQRKALEICHITEPETVRSLIRVRASNPTFNQRSAASVIRKAMAHSELSKKPLSDKDIKTIMMGMDDWASRTMVKIVTERRCMDSKIGLGQALARCGNGERTLKDIVRSKTKEEFAGHLSLAVGQARKSGGTGVSYALLAKDLTDFQGGVSAARECVYGLAVAFYAVK